MATTDTDLFVDGSFVQSSGTARLPVIDPSDGQAMATSVDATDEDVDRAVAAARSAFDPWRETAPRERGRILFKLADTLRARAAELAELESRNSGKPIVEAEGDLEDCADCFEYYGGLASKLTGEVVPTGPEALVLVLREPVGVAA